MHDTAHVEATSYRNPLERKHPRSYSGLSLLRSMVMLRWSPSIPIVDETYFIARSCSSNRRARHRDTQVSPLATRTRLKSVNCNPKKSLLPSLWVTKPVICVENQPQVLVGFLKQKRSGYSASVPPRLGCLCPHFQFIRHRGLSGVYWPRLIGR